MEEVLAVTVARFAVQEPLVEAPAEREDPQDPIGQQTPRESLAIMETLVLQGVTSPFPTDPTVQFSVLLILEICQNLIEDQEFQSDHV